MLALRNLGARNNFLPHDYVQKDTYDYDKDIKQFIWNFLKEPTQISFPVQFVNLILKINKNWENIFTRASAIKSLEEIWESSNSAFQAYVHEIFPKNQSLQPPLHHFLYGSSK